MTYYFSDVFDVPEAALTEFGAFNVSLVNDLPLFVDPFLLFNSKRPEYQQLHEAFIEYICFLRDNCGEVDDNPGLLQSWFCFPEVEQAWLGFSEKGNRGRGLGPDFATALHRSLGTTFSGFGKETITQSSHVEKLSLLRSGIGRDKISDLCTNLIKRYLLEFTEGFARTHLKQDQRRLHQVRKVSFNFDTRTWITDSFELPTFEGNFVILTPSDILTRDETWISRVGMQNRFESVIRSVPNEQLRGELSQYLRHRLKKRSSQSQRTEAFDELCEMHPELLDYYIKMQEDNGDAAQSTSANRVAQTQQVFVNWIRDRAVPHLASSNADPVAEMNPGWQLDRAKQIQQIFAESLVPNDLPKISNETELRILVRLLWFCPVGSIDRELLNTRRNHLNKTVPIAKLGTNPRLAEFAQSTDFATACEHGRASILWCRSESEAAAAHQVVQQLFSSSLLNHVVVLAPGSDTAVTKNSPSKVFISYTAPDRGWAEWIAYVLEEIGMKCIIQAWDFRPGHDFVQQMNNAVLSCDRTIAVISPEYLKSAFASAEWRSVFAMDPTGDLRRLIGVRVKPTEGEGLLHSRIYVDLVGADESDAEQRLTSAFNDRAKPSQRPAYPAHQGVTPPFPGTT